MPTTRHADRPNRILRDDFTLMVSNTHAANLKLAAKPSDAGGV